MCLVRRSLRMRLCPKALLHNISEFIPMKELFILSRRRCWSGQEMAATFIVARGIRGREGVEVVLRFCSSGYPRWGETSYVTQFVEMFETAWREAVRQTGKVGALSHQEHHHAGLSGMNYVETLKDQEYSHSLFGIGGVASRLAPFFEQPQSLDADRLLRFYTELVREPIRMNSGTFAVQLEGARMLGKKYKIEEGEEVKQICSVTDGSYNSCDFLRCYSNIMTEVFESPEVVFTDALWSKMLQCQSKTAQTRQLLSAFGFGMNTANALIAEIPGMNWTTFLVCICELRQAMGEDRESREAFEWLLEKLEARPWLHEAVDDVVRTIVEEGASSRDCYCVRVCVHLHTWLDDLGQRGTLFVHER